MRVFKTIMWIISVICIIPMALALCCFLFIDKPVTVGTVQVATLSAADDDGTALEDSTMFMEWNFYNNKNNNGKTLAEIAFTQYLSVSDAYKKGDANVHTYGYQLYDFDYNTLENKPNFKNLFTYTTDGGHSLKINTILFIPFTVEYAEFHKLNLNSDVYAYEVSYMNKEATSVAVPYTSNNKGFIASIKKGEEVTPFRLALRNHDCRDKNYIDKYQSMWTTNFRYYTIDMNFFIYQMLYSMASLDEGTYYLKLDLSDYFQCYLWDEDDKQFDKLTADVEYTFVTIKVNINNDGVTMQEQSMFGMVANNDGSVTFEADTNTKYWKTYNNISLGMDDFKKRELENGDYYLYLPTEMIEDINSYENVRIFVDLDLTDYEHCIGFDDFAFYNLPIYKLNVTSSTKRNFEIKRYAFLNAPIKEITNKNVKLIYEGGLNG